MRVIVWLVTLAATLFIVGGVGTIAGFLANAPDVRLWFMWIFLAGIVPTMVFLAVSFVVGAFHLAKRARRTRRSE